MTSFVNEPIIETAEEAVREAMVLSNYDGPPVTLFFAAKRKITIRTKGGPFIRLDAFQQHIFLWLDAIAASFNLVQLDSLTVDFASPVDRLAAAFPSPSPTIPVGQALRRFERALILKLAAEDDSYLNSTLDILIDVRSLSAGPGRTTIASGHRPSRVFGPQTYPSAMVPEYFEPCARLMASLRPWALNAQEMTLALKLDPISAHAHLALLAEQAEDVP